MRRKRNRYAYTFDLNKNRTMNARKYEAVPAATRGVSPFITLLFLNFSKRKRKMKITPTIKVSKGTIAKAAPRLVDNPPPPLKFKNNDQLCPMTENIPESITKTAGSPKVNAMNGGRNPFEKSRIKVTIPQNGETSLNTFAAPGFLLPTFRISIPFMYLTIMYAKGIEPRM